MKLFLLTFLFLSSLYADVYYSKVEPIQLRKISSNVNGQVLFIDANKIGKILKNEPYIKIDSKLDINELDSVKEKIEYTRKTLEVDHKILENLKESLEKKKANYKIILSLKIKSTLEKNREFYDLINLQNQYLSTQKEINNLHIQLLDLKLRQAQLLKTLRDKNLVSAGLVLYSLDVKVGQVVNKSTPLATLVDTSKGILTIYLNKEDVKTAQKSNIYLNGEKTVYKISRLSKVADVQNISKYKAQIIIDAPKVFSQLTKIELKKDTNE